MSKQTRGLWIGGLMNAETFVTVAADEYQRLMSINAELLEACRLVQQRLKNNGYHIDELDAAIAKATGGIDE